MYLLIVTVLEGKRLASDISKKALIIAFQGNKMVSFRSADIVTIFIDILTKFYNDLFTEQSHIMSLLIGSINKHQNQEYLLNFTYNLVLIVCYINCTIFKCIRRLFLLMGEKTIAHLLAGSKLYILWLLKIQKNIQNITHALVLPVNKRTKSFFEWIRF